MIPFAKFTSQSAYANGHEEKKQSQKIYKQKPFDTFTLPLNQQVLSTRMGPSAAIVFSGREEMLSGVNAFFSLALLW